MSTHDPAQWVIIVVLLVVSFTCLGLSISNMKLSQQVHSLVGKVDLIKETYVGIFQRMHENLAKAMEFEEDKGR
ncbi:hypothetical protein HWB90_gp002 [Mycobacterium phage Fowlmouth]|uniref:Membrane protein n=2 Tax=Fowlmouthvirus fowlmouth TaxID=2845652 RepID=A0A7G8LPP5_9CAUD|nr:hypothetical protein HWB90_gp002 [Mycobacterium phage Fowlmouth]AYN57952.1 hypothetical protein SEA_FOWLMOUTH_2 [Mycobacterium phage Fowlmouth]QNJ59217.1 membrane protein [Mycobacterium phage MrMiyagi]